MLTSVRLMFFPPVSYVFSLRVRCLFLGGLASRLKVVINYVSFRVFTENSRISAFCFAFSDFFPPRQNTEKQFRELQTKSTTKQNIGQAHGMSRVRRVSPLPAVRDRPASSPASLPGHGWSQKAPCITRAPFVQSTEPTHRHGEIDTK